MPLAGEREGKVNKKGEDVIDAFAYPAINRISR